MPLLPSAAEHRAHRRLAAFALSPSVIPKYESVQADLSVLLCEQLMSGPAKFRDHVRLFAGRVIMSVTYGIRVKQADSEVSRYTSSAILSFTFNAPTYMQFSLVSTSHMRKRRWKLSGVQQCRAHTLLICFLSVRPLPFMFSQDRANQNDHLL